jgi:asparaginyl-tRNA synthetase
MHISKNKTFIKDISTKEGKLAELQGWVMNKRSGKGILFIVLRDGSGFIQCVIAEEKIGEDNFNNVKNIGLESSVVLKGMVVKDDRQIGGYEMQVESITVLQDTPDYPIAKKEHGVDFLMDKRHLWLRSKRQWAIMKVRNQIIFAIHNFYQDRGFVQMDAPIFTGNAVEGTSTLFETEFFERPAYLSQSGQLYGEAMTMAMGLIYTFGPTFRAEKSKTRRHLSEFWMIEPEMAFYDNEMNMDLIEEFLRFVVTDVLEKCKSELEILERDTTMLENVKKGFKRLTYDDAVAILKGEKEVNGQNALKLLEEEILTTKEKISELEKDIQEREDLIAKGGMKKGKLSL